jgi:hypothetical protein
LTNGRIASRANCATFTFGAVRVAHRRKDVAAGVDEIPVGPVLMRRGSHHDDARGAGLFGQRHREPRILHGAVGTVFDNDPVGRKSKQDEHIAHLTGLGAAVSRVAAGDDDR